MTTLKSKKHPQFEDTYVVNEFGKTFHVSKFYDDDLQHTGEWTIFEDIKGDFEWIDTVYTKKYALERIQQLYGEE